MTRPDDPVYRRRALAAMVAHLADYNAERLAPIFVGCQDLHCTIPPTIAAIPAELGRFADQIQRTRTRP